MTNEDLARFFSSKEEPKNAKDHFVRFSDMDIKKSEIKNIIVTQEGIELEFNTGTTALIPIVGSDGIVLDVNEEGSEVEVHIDHNLMDVYNHSIIITSENGSFVGNIALQFQINDYKAYTISELLTKYNTPILVKEASGYVYVNNTLKIISYVEVTDDDELTIYCFDTSSNKDITLVYNGEDLKILKYTKTKILQGE